jgi:hypothetical protein
MVVAATAVKLVEQSRKRCPETIKFPTDSELDEHQIAGPETALAEITLLSIWTVATEASVSK